MVTAGFILNKIIEIKLSLECREYRIYLNLYSINLTSDVGFLAYTKDSNMDRLGVAAKA